MQYKSRLASKPPVAARGVQMRIKRREVIPSSGSGAKARGLAVLLFGSSQESSYGDKLRKQQMMKELLLKRALSPPQRRLTLRWKNFQPTPSRLSMMSTA
ncbi:Chaperone protein HtpG [Bienertia sinuspersici]